MADIRGALVTLRPLSALRISKFHKDLLQKERWQEIHATKPPDLEVLKKRMLERRSIRAWDIIPEGCTTSIGYAGYRVRCGCPFIFLLFVAEPFSRHLAEDIIPPLVTHFFNHTHRRLPDYRQSDPMMLYLEHAIAEQLHAFLIDNGFDPMPDFPIIDHEKQTAYGLLPETYEAYHSDDQTMIDEQELYPDELDS